MIRTFYIVRRIKVPPGLCVAVRSSWSLDGVQADQSSKGGRPRRDGFTWRGKARP